jgi:hypothetical protein
MARFGVTVDKMLSALALWLNPSIAAQNAAVSDPSLLVGIMFKLTLRVISATSVLKTKAYSRHVVANYLLMS